MPICESHHCGSIYSAQAHTTTYLDHHTVLKLPQMIYNRKDLLWVILQLAGQPYLILAQNSSFQGDDFSNNLFSDLGKLFNLIREVGDIFGVPVTILYSSEGETVYMWGR